MGNPCGTNMCTCQQVFARAGSSEPFYFAWIVQIAAAKGELARPCPLFCCMSSLWARHQRDGATLSTLPACRLFSRGIKETAQPCPLYLACRLFSRGIKETTQPCPLLLLIFSVERIARRGSFSEEGGREEYWVHFQGWNNRYDKWVVLENLRPVDAGEVAAPLPRGLNFTHCDRLKRRRLCSAVDRCRGAQKRGPA